MSLHRPGEMEAMEAFIRERGVRREPTAVAVPTQGAFVSKEDLQAIKDHDALLESRRSKVAKQRMSASSLREAEEFRAFAIQIAPTIREILAEKGNLTATAAELKKRGIKSFKRGGWFPSNITSVLKLADKAKAPTQ